MVLLQVKNWNLKHKPWSPWQLYLIVLHHKDKVCNKEYSNKLELVDPWDPKTAGVRLILERDIILFYLSFLYQIEREMDCWRKRLLLFVHLKDLRWHSLFLWINFTFGHLLYFVNSILLRRTESMLHRTWILSHSLLATIFGSWT